MIPSKLALTPFTEGDTFDGTPSLQIRVSEAAPASAIALVTMRFKKAGAVPSEVIELTSEDDGGVTITSPSEWIFEVPAQEVPGLTAGKWAWRIRVTDAEGKKTTYFADTLEVLETV
jgi:hypothetical protein